MDYEESKDYEEQSEGQDEGWGDYDAEIDLVPGLSKELSKEPDIIITNPERMNKIWKSMS